VADISFSYSFFNCLQ